MQLLHERRFSAECFALFTPAPLTHIYQEKRSLSFQKAFQYSKLCTLSNNISSMYLVRICFKVMIKLWRKTFTKENNICHNKDSQGYTRLLTSNWATDPRTYIPLLALKILHSYVFFKFSPIPISLRSFLFFKHLSWLASHQATTV